MQNPPLIVDLAERSYPIRIESGALNSCVAHDGHPTRALLITDSNVAPLYVEKATTFFAQSNFDITVSEIPAGEPSKNMANVTRLLQDAVTAGLDRRSSIIALGGGVVGDTAGYVAASLFRGVNFIQVPTSLMAMVDSSVGGKTGVNLPEGKNLVGAFHQPSLVLADLDTLKTLPKSELIAGMAEVIKYGVIYDADLFAWLESNFQSVLDLDTDALNHVVRRSCEIKADVVRQDEREGGLRAILNFGHTLGHAVEKVTQYKKYLHGEGVGIGMAYAALLSQKVMGLDSDHSQRIIDLVRTAGLPTSDATLDWPALRAAMSVDKKSRDEKPYFVLAKEIGTVEFGVAVDDSALEEVWKEHCAIS